MANRNVRGKNKQFAKSIKKCTKKHPQGINRKKQHPQGLQRFLTEADLAQEEQQEQDTNK